ncbi:MAG: PAS domain-containing sensor histidine kinase [Acidimicrobiales bacterium]
MTNDPLGELTAEIVWQASPDALFLVDSEGRIVWSNKAAEQVFGFSASLLATMSVEDLVPEPVVGSHRELRRRFAEAPSRRPMGPERQLEGRRCDGEIFPVQVSLAPLRLAGEPYTLSAVRDVSLWVETESRLRTAMSDRWVARERERIARDLHDDVIQELFAVGLGLQALAAHPPGPEQLSDRLVEAVRGIDRIVSTIRRVIFDVSRRGSDDRSTLGAVVEVVAEAVPALGFEPTLLVHGDVDAKLDSEVLHQLLPTLREALSNVVRHAEAGRVDVSLDIDTRRGGVRGHDADQVVLVVTDDGRGIAETDRRGRGLTNMVRRATELGGSCEIGPAEGGGTRVRWRAPARIPDTSEPEEFRS